MKIKNKTLQLLSLMLLTKLTYFTDLDLHVAILFLALYNTQCNTDIQTAPKK